MDPPENLPPPPPLPPGLVAERVADPPRQGAGLPPTVPSAAAAPGGGNGAASIAQGSSNPPAQGSSNPPSQVVAAPKVIQMKRSGFGTKGMAVNLECNHFKVKFNPRDDVFHYNVTIEPVTKKGLSRKIMTKLYDTFGQQFLNGRRFAYDGEKSLFTVGRLSFNSHRFPVLLDDEPGRGSRRGGRPPGASSPGDDDEGRPAQRRRIGGRDFAVQIEYAATVNMGVIQAILDGRRDDSGHAAQDALRVLDIMLREHAAKRDYLLIRDSYFHSSLGPVGDIGEGVLAWKGYHVSFRPTSGGCLTLNFDLSTTTVLKPVPVIEFLQDHCKKNISQFMEQDWMKARRVLKGVQVDTYADRRQKILGFSPKPCSQQMFEKKTKNNEGVVTKTEELTVADYFQREKSIRLKFPLLPALDVGRASRPVYMPMELCKIMEGQRYKRNLTGVQRKNHIDQARKLPDERKQICKAAMIKNDYNNDELVKEFNVRIDQNMAIVKGRVLDAPSLMFGNREEKPNNGRWNFNSKTMKVACKIDKWLVVNFGRFPVAAIATQLRQVCAQKGMLLSDATVIDENRQMSHRGAEERVRALLYGQARFAKYDFTNKNQQEEMSMKRPFVLAILPEKSSELYAPLKRVCATEIGVISQCIVPPRTVKDQYLTNVALKINLKWGGYNTVLTFEERKLLPRVSQVPTCIFGLDVSHGSPGDASSPSIAAAVASMSWPNFSKYIPRVRAQAPKTEMIEGLFEDRPADRPGAKAGGMVIELLKAFYTSCQKGVNPKPAQIIIYRDGVSESQFDQVLEKELIAFRKACRALESNYTPKMTLIVVQKRHHTRFFPTNGVGNVRPGTIVDRDVCHPRDNDFFLCSHAGLIGTSRPTHYHVLYDDIGFTADELQHLTHCLCYNYARCTTAVSVAAPAYYAHLAAQHCRNFVDTDGSGSETSSMTGRAGRSVHHFPNLTPNILQNMFYT